MRANFRIAAAGLLAVLWLVGARGSETVAAKPAPAACGEYGTSVQFEKTPSDAARKALKQEKLVMVLHVSGDFENPKFT